MAAPTTREELKLWALKKLGYPVIRVNVDDEQLEDRLDEALQYYQHYHGDAVERFYLHHTITQQNIDDEFITVPDHVTSILRMFPFTSEDQTTAHDSLFSVKYHFHLNYLFDFVNADLVHYDTFQKHLKLLDQFFGRKTPIRHNVHAGRIYIDSVDWEEDFVADESKVVFEAYRAIDPDEFNKIYNDYWLKQYFTALVKKQWAQNLSKYENIQLLGGVTLNGAQLYQQAQEEIQKLEEDVEKRWQLPVDFFMG